MKLGMQEHVDLSSGVVDEVAISFEANAVAFYAQISGLAKDKIGYPIRELSTNAWDASRGRMDIHLPTSLNPTFRVRDYGPGMSAENMKNVYARLYASTKRSSNDEVGGWGLGSKSPYAYLITDSGSGSYTVTSYHEGMMRTYVLSLSQHGAPTMRMLAEMPSNEPSGLDVSFPVRREDIRSFHDRARAILWSFSPRPNMTPAIDWKEPFINSRGDNWTSYKTGSVPFNGPHVRMGCVMYPFDLRQISTSGFLDWNDDVLFDAPIGSLKVTLSREELAYDDNTKATLTALVKSYEDSFTSQLQAKVNEAETLFEATKIFEESVESLGSTRTEALRRIVRWNGMHIGWHVPKDNAKTMVLGKGWQQFDKFEDCHVRSVNVVDAKIVIEHNPSYSFSRFVMANLLGEKVLWIRCKRIFREQVLAALGNPEVIDLDSFKVPVERRVSKTIRRRKTLMILDGGKAQRITQEVDMADGGFFIETAPSNSWRRRGSDYFRISDDTAGIASHNLNEVIATAHKFGLVETGQVILIKGADQPALGDNWTWLGEDLIPGLTAKVDVSEFTGLHHKSYSNLDGYLKYLVEVDGTTFEHAPADVVSFKADLNRLARSLRQNSTVSTDTDLAHAALSKLGVTIDKPEVACPIKAIGARYDVLCRKYLLLQQIVNPPHAYYGRSENLERHLKHYFELLSRPEVDLVVFSDIEEDADELRVIPEAA
jgi:Histidine kinase-, DNA gyrase B-, and HSP90-like ATPase